MVAKKITVLRVWFSVVLLILTCQSYADDEHIANLKTQLAAMTTNDPASVPVLLELADFYLYQAPSLAQEYALQALPISVEAEDDHSRANAFRLLGMASMYLGNTDETFSYLTQAQSVAKGLDDAHLLSVTHRSIGVYYELIVDYDNAVKYYIEAIKYARSSDNVSDLAMVYNNLGNVLNSQGDYSAAADYFTKAATIHESQNNHDMAMNSTVGLGISYLKSQQYNQALSLFKSVLANDEKIYDFTYSEASVNLAHVYQALNMHDDAIAMYRHVIEDPRGGSYPQALASAYLGLAKLYATLERYDDALSLYRSGIVEVRNKTSVESEIALYESLAMLELKLGKYEDAANTQAEYIARRNKIQPVTQAGIIKKLESQLKTERELIQLQEDLLQREREAQHSRFFVFTSVVISLLCLVLFLALRLRQQKLLQLEQTNHSLLIDSETDPLTGIGNRRFLDRQLAAMRSTPVQLAFLLLDIDHFKNLNDTHGHDVGDDILVQLAKGLSALCRKEDVLARIGGEEFVILLPQVDESASMAFAERIRESVADEAFHAKARITVSIGVAVGNTRSASFDELYKQADIALYQAKSDGRNYVRAFS
jgi:diguanylate cyclase (GGDEF)-like protein